MYESAAKSELLTVASEGVIVKERGRKFEKQPGFSVSERLYDRRFCGIMGGRKTD
jgi:hypothetical protein